MNCFRVDTEQAGWLKEQPVFCWGIGGGDVPFPECVFRSTYLGPALFLDEPAVGTRDHVIRPRLAKDPAFRRALTPQVMLEAFKAHFQEAVHEGPPTAFMKSMRARADVDLGAKHFFFWDNYQLACVPYGEYLALARHLQAHVQSHPDRDPSRLKRAAEIAILLPPGYDLGHVHMGRGNLWGLSELNLERVNRHHVRYRQVMANFFSEIERCLRLGVAFDLLEQPGRDRLRAATTDLAGRSTVVWKEFEVRR